MTTVAEAHALIKARALANFTAIGLRFKGDSTVLPDEPVPFAYVELIVEEFPIVAFGGGRGGNLQRNGGRIEAQFLQPTGSGPEGYAQGLAWAETFAAVFRGQRFDGISYFAAAPLPASGRTEDGSYDHVATVVVDLHFDQAA